MRRIIVPLVLGLGLILTGCGSSFQWAGDTGVSEHSADSEGAQGGRAQNAGPGDAEPGTAEPGGSEGSRQVISVGDMRVITADPAEAADDVAEHGESRGGHVESREERVDPDGEVVVGLTLRVPADEFEELMADVDESGEVVQRSQGAEDVTGAVRDLDARIRALEVSTERLEGIMAEADTSADLLEAEAALSERQGELEELVAQRSDLEDQVSMSTLRVDLRETDRADDSGGFTSWLADIWKTLLNSAGGLVLVLTALLPWVIVLGIPAYLLIRWIRRRRSRRQSRSEGTPDAVRGFRQGAPGSRSAAGVGVDGPESPSEGEEGSTGEGSRA